MLIDGHIHYDFYGSPYKILDALKVTNASKCSLESLITKRKINQNFDLFYAKLILKDKVYLDGALDSYLYLHHERINEMPDYIERMMACGMDGIKLLEGKPTARKRFPIPNFDDELFEPTFKYLEEKQIPITWHVNDPEEFWDAEKVPFWAKRNGWFYADGTFVNNEDQYAQIERLLDRHPNLVITFAHFYFLSNDLDRLARIFDKYPRVAVDITPGVELFTNMSSNIEKARIFFKKYSNRILYGTDISVEMGEVNQLNEIDALTRKALCHDFLTKDHFTLKGDEAGLLGKDDLELFGLALDEVDVQKIEALNFLERYHEIKPLNFDLIKKEIKYHREMLIQSGRDTSYLDKIEQELWKEE